MKKKSEQQAKATLATQAPQAAAGKSKGQAPASRVETFAEKITRTIAEIGEELADQSGIYLRDGSPALLNQSEFCRRAGIRAHTFYGSAGRYQADHKRLTTWLKAVAGPRSKREAERAVPRRMREYKVDIEKLAASYQVAEQERILLADRVAQLETENSKLKEEILRLRGSRGDRRVVPIGKSGRASGGADK